MPDHATDRFSAADFASLEELLRITADQMRPLPTAHDSVRRWTQVGRSMHSDDQEVVVYDFLRSDMPTRAVEQVRAVARRYRPDREHKLHYFAGSGSRLDPSHALRVMLKAAFAGGPGSEPDFPGAVRRFEEELLATDIEVEVLGLLSGCVLDENVTSIRVSPGYVLKRFGLSERNLVFGGPPVRRDMLSQIPFSISCIVRGTGNLRTGPKPDLEADAQLVAPIDDCVRALRVLRPGRIGHLATVFTGHQGLNPGIIKASLRPDGWPVGPPMRLAAGDVVELEARMRQLSGELDSQLRFACDRLHDAGTRRADRERVVDAVVGMEAILLTDMPKQNELSHRFALNYAVLGESADERKSRYKSARELYSARSAAVHGSKKGIGKGLADDAVEALRELVLRFLHQGQHPAYRESGFWLDRLLG